MKNRYDVVIIGAGVVGAAIARELSRYQLKTVVLDKNSDVCEGTSKANSGIVHAGHDAEPGTLKARLNVLGSQMMPELARTLEIPFIQNGAMVVCTQEQDLPKLKELYERGIKNGVEHLKLLSRAEAMELEPNLSDDTVEVLYAPSSAIICPFHLTMALAENACENGVLFHLSTRVLNIKKTAEGYLLTAVHDDGETEKCVEYYANLVINAAGVYADEIHNMVCEQKMKITARRGEYCLLDTTAGNYVSKTIFRVPGALGKGILVTPTVHGNLLVGPTAEDIPDKEGTDTTAEGLKKVNQTSEAAVKNLPMREVITSFSGLRAHLAAGDFVIEETAENKNFIDVAGIESPGLTASPAIGCMVRDIVLNCLQPVQKAAFTEKRRGITLLNFLPIEDRRALIEKNPAYGNMICRCSGVTEGEILDAIHRPLGATTLDGVKRRTGSGMGRCQGGFCTPKIMEILSRELSIPFEKITKCGRGSELIVGRNKAIKDLEEKHE